MDIGFSLEIETNLKEVDFLDVICEMELIVLTKSQNGRLLYIHSLSKHPPNVIKQIPKSIHERLSKNSSNEEIFNTSKCEYEDVLKKSRFKVDLKYTKNQQQKPKIRFRNIIWFNPPFNKAIFIKCCKNFSSIDQYTFSKSHRLHKIFNRNTVKVR